MFRIIKYGLLVIVPIILLAVLYFSLHGLPEPLTRNIERQLQFSGMVLSLDKIRLGVFEGIIATRVCYHRKGDIGDPVFAADKIVLQYDPWGWLKGEVVFAGAKIKNGVFRLMIAAETGGRVSNACSRMLTFDKLQAHVRWDQPFGIHVEEFSARLSGIHLTGRGTLTLPAVEPSLAAAGEAEPQRETPEVVWKILRMCQAVRLSNAVNADVVFWVDPSDIQNLVLNVKMDSWNTHAGLSSVGVWRAGIDVRGMTAKGFLEIKDSNVQGVRVEQACCLFQCDEQALNVERMEARVGRGADRGPLHISGNYDWASTEFKGQVESEIHPQTLKLLLRQQCPSSAWILEDCQFAREPPVIAAVFRGRWNPEWHFNLDGQVQVHNMSYCGVRLAEMQTSVAVCMRGTNGSVTLAPLKIIRPEGLARGEVCVDMGGQAVSFDAESTLAPYALSRMLTPFIEQVVRSFHFDGPARGAAWGTVGFMDSLQDDMELEVSARRAGWRMFLADTCSISLRLLGDHTEITDIFGTIYNGQFDARASIYPVQGITNTRYEVDATVRDIDFSRMMGAMLACRPAKRRTSGASRAINALAMISAWPRVDKPSEVYEGKLAAHVALEGFAGDGQGRTARGAGWMNITEGRIFQIPLFGGLSDFLTRIIPGMSVLLRQTDAKASFVIADGKIHSDEILIEGDIFSLVGKGDYYLDGTLDFTFQVKLLRKHTLAADVFRFVTHPVSKMLEFHLGGTLESPRWRPVHIPKEVFLMFD